MEVESEKNEYYSVVIWTDADKKIHIVGSLVYFEGKYYFKYEQTSLKKAREKGFTDIGSFTDDNKLYISKNSLFDIFKRRVSKKVQETPEAMKELISKQGKSTVDAISIREISKIYRPAIKAEIKRLEKDQKEKDLVL